LKLRLILGLDLAPVTLTDLFQDDHPLGRIFFLRGTYDVK